MNGNRNSSMMQSRYGVTPEADFTQISGVHRYEGPQGAGAGLQAGNRSSTSFVFESKALSPDKPLSLSADTGTSLLGARSNMGQLPGMGA